MGTKFTYANEIARKAGGDCTIAFVSRKISSHFDGKTGDCLLIEADRMANVEITESALVTRAAEILFADDKLPAAVVQPSLTEPSSPTPEEILPEIRRHVIVDNSNVFTVYLLSHSR